MTMKIIIYLVVTFILICAYVRYLESKSVFYPAGLLAATPREIGLRYEDLFMETQDGAAIHGWLIKAPSAKSVLIFLHGNAGNIGDRLGKIDLFYKMGINILIFDYQGYGQSKGRPTEQGIYNDTLAAFDYLKGRSDIKTMPVVAYGESLGGAAAVDLAAKRPLAALILDSTFSSAADMAGKMYPYLPTCCMSVKFDSIHKIKGVGTPKLFIHSTEDEIVPYALGRKLYEAAPAPKVFVDIVGDHNDGYVNDGEKVKEGIKGFLKNLDLI